MTDTPLPRATQVLHAGHWQERTAKEGGTE